MMHSFLLKALRLVIFLIAAVVPAGIFAQNYPELYLRGSNIGNWSVSENYRLDREENVYTIHLVNFSGEFKISDKDWNIEYGALNGDVSQIEQSAIVSGIKGGHNFKIPTPADVRISLAYNPEQPDYATITITLNGYKPEGIGVSGTLPVLHINVYYNYTDKDKHGPLDNSILSKDLQHKDYFSGNYWLDINGCDIFDGAESIGSEAEPLDLQIKARGNFTRRAFAKKPFKLKLAKKQSLLGLSKSKHYAILAHADDDKGYLRNFTGFNLGRRIGLPWTPWQQPVEVIINGDYRGLYFLTESIRTGDDRVPVEELEDLETDPSLVSGGYIVELDNYDEDDAHQIRLEEKGQAPGRKDKLRITFDTPEEYSPIQRRFITDQFTAINDAVGDNSDRLWSYLDLDDAARYYIVEEIISHTEAYHCSTYLFRDRGEGEKWHFSPLWDCGNAFNGPTDAFFYERPAFSCTWIPSLRLNQKFNSKVEETWRWFMSGPFRGFYDDIYAYTDAIATAAKADRRRWKNAPQPEGESRPVADNSDMTSRRDGVISHLKAKIDWLGSQFGYFSAPAPEPARDTTLAAPLPGYLTGAAIGGLPDADTQQPVYYDLLGLPVDNPQPGTVYIRRCGTQAEKILF